MKVFETFIAIISLLLLMMLATQAACAQIPSPPTRAQELRGALRPERTAYDVTHYALDVELMPKDSSISGTVAITFRGVAPSDTIQLDLDRRLHLDGVEQAGHSLAYRREENAVFVGLHRPTSPDALDTLTIRYHGQPRVAVNPPWDGGISWSRDTLGRPFLGVSCEGLGASIWWPNKDHLSDEPDSMSIALTVPKPLTAIANGQKTGYTALSNERHRFAYAVAYPINSYNVSFYVGHYLTFGDTLQVSGDVEPLQLTYSVLDYNEQRARDHFTQVKPMLRCYEQLLGPYPFWQDGYALIEAPYLGMEHQSAIAYGNDFQRGYNGGMIPEDMDWDYLIIHESGHEYFGNALSVSDHGEMWLHESFTTYLEALYVECQFGHADYNRYLLSQRDFIRNDEPILGPLDVNYTDFADSDQYYKGAWILHTFRSAVGDEAFMAFLKAFYQDHAIGMINTSMWRSAVVDEFGSTYGPFWDHYLKKANLPKLVVRAGVEAGTTTAYFEGVSSTFSLPLKLGSLRVPVGTLATPLLLSAEEWDKLVESDYLLLYDVQPLKKR